ncbi:unnamed protein product, partial [Ixodes hexagonus]
ILALLSSVIIACSFAAEPPVVDTPSGSLAGVRLSFENKTTEAFFGIPYAVPPVGDLRFRKPVPFPPWRTVRSASHYGSACSQLDFRIHYGVILNNSFSSEDCLYLNVWKPSCAVAGKCASKLPVVVYVYGGAFQWGDTSMFYNDGLVFSSVNEVVFVSFNYRAGVFGFLTTATPEAPGNLPFWDQLLALKWVQKHIAAFGGDPELVTLYGQSSGAMAVGVHALSPLSKGLFKRCIFESGTPLSLLTFPTDGQTSRLQYIASATECVSPSQNLSELLTCLRQVETEQIISASKGSRLGSVMYYPLRGDEFLPQSLFSEDTIGHINGEEMLMGSTVDEGSLFILHVLDINKAFSRLVSEYIDTVVPVFLSRALNVPSAVARKYVQSYFLRGEKGASQEDILNRLGHTYGDVVFVCATNLWGEFLAKRGHDVYRYVYGQRMSLSHWPKWTGIVHGDDLPYMLGSVALLKKNLKEERWRYIPAWFREMSIPPAELAFSKHAVQALGNFAKTG